MLKTIWQKIEELNQKYFFDFFIVFVLAILLFAWLQSSPTLPEPDSFYHAKIAQFLAQGEILKQFPWLQQTALRENFVDHHFLYHLLLVPFIKMFPPLVGVKVATVIFATLTTVLIYWLFKKMYVKWPFLFIIILLSNNPWLFRASLVKAPVVMLSLIILSFYFTTHQKYKSLAVVSFISVWLYGGWPLIPLIVFLNVIIIWLLEKFKKTDSLWQKVKNFLNVKKHQVIPWSAISYCFSGIIFGIVINPYFPQNLNFYWQQIIKIAVINYQNVIGVGGEWYPYHLLNLLADASLVCALLIVSLLLFILTFRKQSSYSWFFGILTILFLFLTLKSRRNVEFFIPVAVIFSALVFSDYLKNFSFLKMIKQFKKGWLAVFILLFLVVILSFTFHLPEDLLKTKKDMNNGWPLNHYQKSADWLVKNSPANAIVFNADWDDFPALFFYNSHNYYLIGLDPTFMYEQNRQKYWQYVNVTLGKEQLKLKPVIKDIFQADYVFLDNDHKPLNNQLKFDSNFVLVYQDEEVKIYKVNNNYD